MYGRVLRLDQGHVQPHFGALVLFCKARDRQFQCTVSIQTDVTEATREPQPLLDV